MYFFKNIYIFYYFFFNVNMSVFVSCGTCGCSWLRTHFYASSLRNWVGDIFIEASL